MAKNIKGTTPSGFKFEISERRLNNYELLELLGEVDEGNGQAFPKVLKLLFGEESKPRLLRIICGKGTGLCQLIS